MTPGTYKMRCVEAALCQKEKGTEYIGALLEIAEGDFAGDQITAFLWWTEKTEERTKKDLDVMGWKGGVENDANGKCWLTGLSNTFDVGVNEEEYKGEKRIKVGWIGSPPAGISSKERLSMQQAKSFLSRLRGGNGQARSGGGGGGGGGGHADDSDIPFVTCTPNVWGL